MIDEFMLPCAKVRLFFHTTKFHDVLFGGFEQKVYLCSANEIMINQNNKKQWLKL